MVQLLFLLVVSIVQDSKGNVYESLGVDQSGKVSAVGVDGKMSTIDKADIKQSYNFGLKDFQNFTESVKQGKQISQQTLAESELNGEFAQIEETVRAYEYLGDEQFPTMVNGQYVDNAKVVVTAKTIDGKQYQIIYGGVNNVSPGNPMIGIDKETGEKRMISDRELSQVDIIPAEQMIAELKSEASQRIKSKYQLQQVAEDVKESYQPGDIVQFNGMDAEIVDVSDPSQGVTIKLTDAKGAEQVVTIPPDQLASLQAPVQAAETPAAETQQPPAPTRKMVIGKKEFTYEEKPDNTYFVPFKDGKDETKAITAEVDDTQFDVVPVTEEVPIENAPPFAKVKTRTVVKGVNIVPKQTANGTDIAPAVDPAAQDNAAEAQPEAAQTVATDVQPSVDAVGHGAAETAVADVVNPQPEAANPHANEVNPSLEAVNPQPEQAQQPTNEQQEESEGLSEEVNPQESEQASAIAAAEAQVNLNPTEAQKEAGNYQKGHVTVQGFDITIENPKGSTRSGVDKDGNAWSVTMKNTYGYFKRTNGKDGDQIDVFIGGNPDGGKLYVVDQNNDKGEFDESKVMLGFDSAEEAKAAYMSNYSPGWKGFGSITETTVEDFKKWLYDGARQRKPYSEYKDTPEPINTNNVSNAPAPVDSGQNTPASPTPASPVVNEQVAGVNGETKGEVVADPKPKELKPKRKWRESKEQQQVKNMEFFSPIHLAMQYFATGGKIKTSEIYRMFGSGMKGESERRRRFAWTSQNGSTVEQIAHNLWESNAYLNFDTSDYYNAIEEAIREHTSPQAMAASLVNSSAEGLGQPPMTAEYEAFLERELENNILNELDRLAMENDAYPSEEEINSLFLPYETTEDETDKGTEQDVSGRTDTEIAGENRTAEVADNGEVEQGTEEDGQEVAPEPGRKEQIAAQKEVIGKLEKELNKATNKLAKLRESLRDFDKVGQIDMFNNVIEGKDRLDFGNREQERADMVALIEKAERSVSDITAKITEEHNKLEGIWQVKAEIPEVEQPQPTTAGDKLKQMLGKENPVQPETINAPVEKIEDFGEKIEGAKKDTWKAINPAVSDIESQPLSKTFPRPDFVKLVADGTLTEDGAMIMMFLYDNIPTKPQKSYKVVRWAKQVQDAIITMNDFVENPANAQKFMDNLSAIERGRYSSLAKDFFWYRDVKKALGFPAEDVRTGQYEIKKFDRIPGESEPNGKTTYSIVKDRYIIKDFDTLEDAANGKKIFWPQIKRNLAMLS